MLILLATGHRCRKDLAAWRSIGRRAGGDSSTPRVSGPGLRLSDRPVSVMAMHSVQSQDSWCLHMREEVLHIFIASRPWQEMPLTACPARDSCRPLFRDLTGNFNAPSTCCRICADTSMSQALIRGDGSVAAWGDRACGGWLLGPTRAQHELSATLQVTAAQSQTNSSP